MERQVHKACYGTMFPDALHFRENEPMNGKVFMYELDSCGGMYTLRSDRKYSANVEEWDDCLNCPEFDHCYKYCMAKMALQSVIISE